MAYPNLVAGVNVTLSSGSYGIRVSTVTPTTR